MRTRFPIAPILFAVLIAGFVATLSLGPGQSDPFVLMTASVGPAPYA